MATQAEPTIPPRSQRRRVRNAKRLLEGRNLSLMDRHHDTEIRVRYSETDAMGFLHHANYLNYFEIGRTELLRSKGGNYRAIEESGLFLVVVSLNCKYHAPAHYDDLLTLKTRVTRVTPAKLQHEYKVYRGDLLLASAQSVLACLDREGKIRRIPQSITELA